RAHVPHSDGRPQPLAGLTRPRRPGTPPGVSHRSPRSRSRSLGPQRTVRRCPSSHGPSKASPPQSARGLEFAPTTRWVAQLDPGPAAPVRAALSSYRHPDESSSLLVPIGGLLGRLALRGGMTALESVAPWPRILTNPSPSRRSC